MMMNPYLENLVENLVDSVESQSSRIDKIKNMVIYPHGKANGGNKQKEPR